MFHNTEKISVDQEAWGLEFKVATYFRNPTRNVLCEENWLKDKFNRAYELNLHV